MMTKVFFAFHYERELWRAQVVRQTWIDQGGEALGFWDETAWQHARAGERHLEFIDQAIKAAEVTAVLITRGASDQGYVQYAVRKSHHAGKGLLAIYFHNIPDTQGQTAPIGDTHFGEIDRNAKGDRIFFWQRYPTYRWVIDDGPHNIRQWIGHAAAASRRARKGVADA